jgi:hypothetical protein
MQQQSIAVVWSVVDDETCESDWGVLFVASVFTLEDPPAGVTEGSARLGCPRNTSGLASASAFLTSYCATEACAFGAPNVNQVESTVPPAASNLNR